MMKRWIWLGLLWTGPLMAGDFTIASFNGHGEMRLTNSFGSGVVVIESAPVLNSAGAGWTALMNLFSSGPAVSARVPVAGPSDFYRARAVDLSGGPAGFSNLVHGYGMLIPRAGAGGSAANTYHDWFYRDPDSPKVSRVRSVTMDPFGNILFVENDAGYVRMIRFLPPTP
jgi:hypothetical protein